MPRLLSLSIACLFVSVFNPAQISAQTPDEASCFERLVTALAGDDMEGRGVGTEGLVRSRDFLVNEMRTILNQVSPGFLQSFEVSIGVSLGDENRLDWQMGPEERVVEGALTEDFIPLGFSDSAPFSGPVTFVGYGITADEIGYDDYENIDVTGHVVLAFRFEPGERDDESPFNGRRPSRWSELRLKASVARHAGAAALIVVSPPSDDSEEPDSLPSLRLLGPTSSAGIPVVQITRAAADRWLAGNELTLEELQAAIDSDYQPRSVRLDGLSATGNVALTAETARVDNVIGIVPGVGHLAEETIVVGAHYDHLGFGGHGSLAPDSEEIHNGADDNASGVAAMLCSVQELRNQLSSDPRRTLLVAAFTAEEIGLGGSGYYVDHPLRELTTTRAMVNLDMVGRIGDDRLAVEGAESALEWREWITPLAETVQLELDLSGDGYGPSDQMSFYTQGIPVVHFFSGAHDDYHKPSDDVEHLNMDGGARVASLLSQLLHQLVTQDAVPTYQEPSSIHAMQGDSRGYGAYLGTIPDYTAMSDSSGGVLLSDVRPDGPADRAGIRGGDRIVRMGDWTIENLYDMTYALQDNRPGDVIQVDVLRDGVRVELNATLGSRRASTEPSPHGDSEIDPHSGEASSMPTEITSQPSSLPSWSPTAGTPADHLLDSHETRLSELRQLTFGGENAEGYFSPDGRHLIYQSTTSDEGGCDQQYLLDLTTGDVQLVSSAMGRTTCGYFSYPDGDRYIYSTTEHVSDECPDPPDRSQGYVWPLFDFDLVWQEGVNGQPTPFLPSPAYDAEATVCPVDGRVVFTSTRNGDLDLYIVNPDGTGLEQVTDTLGYDGGAFFTADCTGLVWRASRPEGEDMADYQRLLGLNLVRPSALDVYWRDLASGETQQLTDNGAANFGPFPSPDDRGLLFASNLGDSPREFEIWWVAREGGEPERITFSEQFDGFPVISPDGQWLVFASNRGALNHQTNLFIARWSAP